VSLGIDVGNVYLSASLLPDEARAIAEELHEHAHRAEQMEAWDEKQEQQIIE
jgi:hypothetical protein